MLSNVETGYHMQYRPTENSIQGKAVVILGDFSDISRATAGMLAEKGALVFIAAHSSADLTTTLAAAAQAGGKCDGLAIDLFRPEEIQRFFDQAERWLGHIDAVVNCLAADLEGCQNLWNQEAIRRMGSHGQIINVNLAGRKSSSPATRTLAAALRRQASELGIRVTLVEPGSEEVRLAGEDVASCVVDSLAQPYGMDVIFLQGQIQ